jgi:predicted GIY-YIG superfamily endonuclease
MSFIVYQITNTVNGKRYIGYTGRTLEKRWTRHLESASRAKRGKKKKATLFDNAINKYEKDCFIKEIIFKEPTDRCAKETEILMILDRNPEYNLTFGGDGLSGKAIEELRERNKGNKYASGRVWEKESIDKLSESLKNSHKENPRVFTEEHRQKLSKSQTGRKHPDSVKKKISIGNTGKVVPQHVIDAVIESNKRRKGEKRSPEWCQFMSEFMSNREISDETKNKISKTLTGYKHTEEACKNMGNSRLGKKRGPYKVSAERSPAQKAADDARKGVKRGPYKKKLKEQFHA